MHSSVLYYSQFIPKCGREDKKENRKHRETVIGKYETESFSAKIAHSLFLGKYVPSSFCVSESC
jgi:hypothetical protein